MSLRALLARLLDALLGPGPALVWEPEAEEGGEAPEEVTPFSAWRDLRPHVPSIV